MRRILLLPLLATIALGGCGFQPMYADGGGLNAAMSNIDIETGRERTDYLLRQSLLESLGDSAGEAAEYVLRLDTVENRRAFGLRVDGVATRFEVRLSSSYSLIRRSDGAIVTSGVRTGTAAYAVPADPYGEIAAEEKARERAVAVLGDSLRLDINRFFRSGIKGVNTNAGARRAEPTYGPCSSSPDQVASNEPCETKPAPDGVELLESPAPDAAG